MKACRLLILAVLAACAPKTLEQRLLNAEHQAGKAEEFLDRADAAMDRFEPDPASELLEDAQRELSDPDVGYYPEREILQNRLSKARARLALVRAEVAKRKLAEEVDRQRLDVEPRLAKLKESTARVRGTSANRSQVEDAEDALKEAERSLKAGKDLETRDPPYGEWAQRARSTVEQLAPEILLADQRVRFRDGPGAEALEGTGVEKRARALRKGQGRVELAEKALEHFSSCSREAKRLLEDAPPTLSHAELGLAGLPSYAPAVLSFCQAHARAMENEVAIGKRALAAEQRRRAKRPKR